MDRNRDTIDSEPPVLEVSPYGTVDEAGQYLEHAAVVPQPSRPGAQAVATIVVDVPVVRSSTSEERRASAAGTRPAVSTLPPRGHGGFAFTRRLMTRIEHNRGPLLVLSVGLVMIVVTVFVALLWR